MPATVTSTMDNLYSTTERSFLMGRHGRSMRHHKSKKRKRGSSKRGKHNTKKQYRNESVEWQLSWP